jgi:hypothetical protein
VSPAKNLLLAVSFEVFYYKGPRVIIRIAGEVYEKFKTGNKKNPKENSSRNLKLRAKALGN